MRGLEAAWLATLLGREVDGGLAMAAAYALADGLDSPSLRELAAVPVRQKADADELRLLRAALGELGYAVPPPYAGPWKRVRALLPAPAVLRIEAAVAVVDRDVRRTVPGAATPFAPMPVGVDVDGEPEILVATRSGEYWGSAGLIRVDASFVGTLVDAARSASDVVMELYRHLWPVCGEHDRDVLVPKVLDGRAAWTCVPGSHVVGLVGSLPG